MKEKASDGFVFSAGPEFTDVVLRILAESEMLIGVILDNLQYTVELSRIGDHKWKAVEYYDDDSLAVCTILTFTAERVHKIEVFSDRAFVKLHS